MIKEALLRQHRKVLEEYGLADIDMNGLSVLRFKKTNISSGKGIQVSSYCW